MGDLFKSKHRIGLIIGAIFLALTLATGTVAWVLIEEGVFAAADPGQAERAPSGGVEYRLEREQEEGRYGSQHEPEIYDVTPVAPVHNFPSEMRGVYLVPGIDFLTDVNASPSAIRAEPHAGAPALSSQIFSPVSTSIA